MRNTRLLAFVLLVCMLFSGCSRAKDAGTEDDGNTLTITLGVRNNLEHFIEGIQAQFPDIHFVIEPTFCANPTESLRQMLLNDETSDIFYFSQKLENEDAPEHLLDLSSYDFIHNFDRAILNSYTIDGRIYQIPGPVVLRCMAYNKTLFEEHGWKKPENHAELVALCRQIRAETDDITPIAMSFGNVGYPFTFVTTLSQAGFLGTPDGEAWEQEFRAGNASIAEGWGEGLEMVAELIDAKAFNPEPYIGVWDAEACQMEFAQGKAAMFALWGGQESILNMAEQSEYEYAFFPFYGMEDGENVIGALSSFAWGLPKRLAEPGNEEKLENALRVMEWFATPEGQELMKAVVRDQQGNEVLSTAEVSTLNVAGGTVNSSPYFEELWGLAERGNKMPMVYSGYESVMINAGTIIQDAIRVGSSEGMIENFVSTVDADYQAYLAGSGSGTLGEVRGDLFQTETAQLMAHVLYTSGLGDFALITSNGRAGKGIYNQEGAGPRLLHGRITTLNYNIALGGTEALQTLTLTGEQVKTLLAGGKRITSDFDETQSARFPYYWSGIDVELARDGSVVSVRLNGSELDDNRVYTVVFSSGDYSDEIAKVGHPVDSGIMLEKLWWYYIRNNTPISAPEVLRKQPGGV